MEKLGRIVRLQIQTQPVKRRGIGYRPEPILAVGRAALTPGGVLGDHEGRWLVDSHHRSYPDRPGRAGRVLSIGFSSHYALMRERFGEVVTDGIAGENLIVDVAGRITEADLAGGLVIRTAGGEETVIAGLKVATPCLEFTSYLLGLPEVGTLEELRADVDFLQAGMRGFIAGLDLPAPVVIAVGDEVWLRS